MRTRRRGPHLLSGIPVAALLGALAVALVGAAAIGISLGSVDEPLGAVWRVVGAHVFHTGTTDPLRDQIVWQIRVPRVLLAAVAGAGLSVAGVAFQALVRNPLADPYILGVSSGASLGAVGIAVAGGAVGGGVVGGLGQTGAAFVTALLTVVAVYLLAQRSGRLLDSWLVLAGIAVGYLCTGVTTYMQLRLNPTELQGMMFWLMGSLAGAKWSDLGIPTAVIVSCLAVLLSQGRRLNALSAGEDAAAGLGVPVAAQRALLLVIGSLLTASIVSVVGGVGFVGLMVPHMTRFAVGADHRRVLPVSALAGAVFLVLVDLLARTLNRPDELPVGLVTTVLGAPFFLWLLRRRTAKAGG
ncbi:FecCD family ABC transporter permease [Catenulispora sp. GP43]|uniref:FecCD family ABC transporter permease n=1 Tax=Catenulispora sp. GP43 TaxID=3156263 RepID=UPI003510EB8E